MKSKYKHKFQRHNEVFMVEDLKQNVLSIYSDTGVKSLNMKKNEHASISKDDFNMFLRHELKGFIEII